MHKFTQFVQLELPHDGNYHQEIRTSITHIQLLHQTLQSLTIAINSHTIHQHSYSINYKLRTQLIGIEDLLFETIRQLTQVFNEIQLQKFVLAAPPPPSSNHPSTSFND